MNKIFCVNCGHKNIYEIQTPKFCAGCGSQIGVFASDSKNKDDEENPSEIFAKKLDVEIEGEGRLSLGEVMNEQRSHYPKSTRETKRKR